MTIASCKRPNPNTPTHPSPLVVASQPTSSTSPGSRVSGLRSSKPLTLNARHVLSCSLLKDGIDLMNQADLLVRTSPSSPPAVFAHAPRHPPQHPYVAPPAAPPAAPPIYCATRRATRRAARSPLHQPRAAPPAAPPAAIVRCATCRATCCATTRCVTRRRATRLARHLLRHLPRHPLLRHSARSPTAPSPSHFTRRCAACCAGRYSV